MGEACLAKHVEEQGAALALLVTRINLNPDYSDSDSGEECHHHLHSLNSL